MLEILKHFHDFKKFIELFNKNEFKFKIKPIKELSLSDLKKRNVELDYNDPYVLITPKTVKSFFNNIYTFQVMLTKYCVKYLKNVWMKNENGIYYFEELEESFQHKVKYHFNKNNFKYDYYEANTSICHLITEDEVVDYLKVHRDYKGNYSEVFGYIESWKQANEDDKLIRFNHLLKDKFFIVDNKPYYVFNCSEEEIELITIVKGHRNIVYEYKKIRPNDDFLLKDFNFNVSDKTKSLLTAIINYVM